MGKHTSGRGACGCSCPGCCARARRNRGRLWRRRRRGGRAGGDGARRDGACRDGSACRHGGAGRDGAPAETTAGGGEPIKIGTILTCEDRSRVPTRPRSQARSSRHRAPGRRPAGRPSDGITWEVSRHPVEIVFGCSDATPDRALSEARRLVGEEEGVDILHAPLSGSEGIAIANYCLEQPDVTFVNGTSGAQDTTLKVQCPNGYRFHTDGAQWMAGLGDYAYNDLGWRRVVTIGDDYDFPYTQTAGFVAEFCSLGESSIASGRLWARRTTPRTSLRSPMTSTGLPLRRRHGDARIREAVRQLKARSGDKIIGGSIAIDPTVLTDPDVGPRMVGVVSGSGSTDRARPRRIARSTSRPSRTTGDRTSREPIRQWFLWRLGSLRGKLGQRR